MTLAELRAAIEQQGALMVAVATGGPQINTVQAQYIARREEIQSELQRLGIRDPNEFSDLWAWYGYYSQNFGRWHERRTYIRELYEPLLAELDALGEQDIGARLAEEERTGWERVDDQVVQLRERLRAAETSEDHQAVGLLCRDIFVSLSEAVYDEALHPGEDGEPPTQLRDKLLAVAQHEAAGASNDELRKLLKASIDYTNKVQHSREATSQHARIVAEATVATVNLIRAMVVSDVE